MLSIRRQAAHLVAVVATTALISSYPTFAQQVPGQPADDFMPEWYVSEPIQQSCTLRANFRSASRERRMEKLLSGIDLTYAETEAWRQNFTISGVDYLDFRYAHVNTFRPCSESEALISGLSQAFGTERSDWDILEHSNFLSTIEELDGRGPVGVFIRYRSKSQIRPCLVRIQFASIETAISATENFHLLRRKYLPPIADITFIDRNLYLLMSRQCDQKRAIYDRLLFLLKREEMEQEDLGLADFDPSPYEYFSLNQCQFEESKEDGICKP